MLRVYGSAYRDGCGITRRNFVQVGVPMLGLGLPALLRHQAAAASSGQPTGRKKSLIVFWTHGGISQQDTWDMKPHAPAEYRGFYKTIPTVVPGVSITERYPYQAKVMDKISIVRSVYHKNGIHAPSAHWMCTGHFGPTLARIAPQYPSFGSVISRSLGAHAQHMPPYVAVPRAEAFGYQKAHYLGAEYDPFEVGANPNPIAAHPTQQVRYAETRHRQLGSPRRSQFVQGASLGNGGRRESPRGVRHQS